MTIRTVITAVLFATASTAAAQDFNAMNNAFNTDLNAAMNGVLNNIITTNVNDPQIQQMYYQAVQSGRYFGSIEQFAYDYAQTGGWSQRGMENLTNLNSDLANRHNGMMRDYWNSQNVYRDAYNGLTGGFADNAWERGLGLTGQNTYTGNYGNQQLPHTWQPGYYNYNGNRYLVDNTGRYWMADPNGGSGWAPLN